MFLILWVKSSWNSIQGCKVWLVNCFNYNLKCVRFPSFFFNLSQNETFSLATATQYCFGFVVDVVAHPSPLQRDPLGTSCVILDQSRVLFSSK